MKTITYVIQQTKRNKSNVVYIKKKIKPNPRKNISLAYIMAFIATAIGLK